VYGYLSKESLEFSVLVSFEQTPIWFLSHTKNFEFPKKIFVNTWYFWRNGFMFKGYAQCVICMKQQQKERHVRDNKKKLIWQRNSCGILSQITNKIGTGWNKNQEVLQAWSNKGRFFFFFLQNKNILHTALVVQFPFSQPSHKSFFRNVVLCWGSWLYLPPISSGWVVVGVWTKMID